MNIEYVLKLIWSRILYIEKMEKRGTYRLASLPIILREVRTRPPKITQAKVAERLDVSETYISNLEHGRVYPSIGMFVRIAEALEVRPGELLDAIVEHEKTMQATAADQIQPPTKHKYTGPSRKKQAD